MEIKYLCLFILLSLTSYIRSEDRQQYSLNKMTFIIKGKKLDSLYLKGYVFGSKDYIIFNGHTKDNSEWVFDIPDSILNAIKYLKLETAPFDLSTKTIKEVKLNGIFNTDTLSTFEFCYDPAMPIIEAEYIKTEKETIPFLAQDMLFIEDAISLTDVFRVNFTRKNSELEIAMKNPTIGFFQPDFSHEQYKNEINLYKHLVDTTPNSKYLLRRLAMTMDNFQDIKDIESIYERFSMELKCSYIGGIVNRYISDIRFENVKLLNSQTLDMEDVIVDKSKYNLLSFSAFWCGPCRIKIPFLKEINSEMSDVLNIIYISIDEDKTIPNWKNLMVSQQIPWRSLLLEDDKYNILQKYAIQGIPAYLLVYPNERKTVRIKLNNESDKKELLRLILFGEGL